MLNSRRVAQSCHHNSIRLLRNSTRHQFARRPIRTTTTTTRRFVLGVAFLDALLVDLSKLWSSSEADKEPLDPYQVIHLSLKRAILAMWRGELHKSEQILHITLKLAQDLADSQAETYIFDMLANVYMQLGEVEASERLFRVVMQREMALGKTPDDLSIIDMSLKMAHLCAEKGQTAVAQDGFDFALGRVEERLRLEEEEEHSTDLMMMFFKTIDWYSQFLVERHGERPLMKLLDRAQQLCLRYPESLGRHAEYPLLLSNRAAAFSLAADYDSALGCLVQAAVAAPDPESRHRSTVLVNLGRTHLELGRLYDASVNCKTALRLAKQLEDQAVMDEARECLERLEEEKRSRRAR